MYLIRTSQSIITPVQLNNYPGVYLGTTFPRGVVGECDSFSEASSCLAPIQSTTWAARTAGPNDFHLKKLFTVFLLLLKNCTSHKDNISQVYSQVDSECTSLTAAALTIA